MKNKHSAQPGKTNMMVRVICIILCILLAGGSIVATLISLL